MNRSYKPLTPEEREAKRKKYEEEKLKKAEAQVQMNKDNTVNMEYFFYLLLKNNPRNINPEELKTFCEEKNLDYNRIMKYMLFS